MTTYTARYSSWGEWLEHCESGRSDMASAERRSRETGNTSFRGTRDFAEAMDLARNGWHDGTARCDRLNRALVDKISATMVRDEYRYDTTGVTFDVALVCEGQPECWLDCEQIQVLGASTRVLRLVLNGAVSHSISTEVIIAKGAAVASLICCLERVGLRVAVDLVFAVSEGSGYGETHATSIEIKRADQDLDLARLVFALAHPSSLRRLWFSGQECLSSELRSKFRVGGNYAYPTSIPTELLADISVDRSFAGEPQWDSPAATEVWVRAELDRHGVRFSS